MPATQGTAGRGHAVATIHLIEGPVGAGKSTFAANLSLREKALHLNLDQWMVTLFAPDRPSGDFVAWYVERKSRCIQQIWDLTVQLLDNGSSAVLEIGLVQLADREAFYRRIDGTEHQLRVYLIDTPLALRRERVQRRNANKSDTYQMAVSDEMFDLANRFWEAPSDAECQVRNIELVRV